MKYWDFEPMSLTSLLSPFSVCWWVCTSCMPASQWACIMYIPASRQVCTACILTSWLVRTPYIPASSIQTTCLSGHALCTYLPLDRCAPHAYSPLDGCAPRTYPPQAFKPCWQGFLCFAAPPLPKPANCHPHPIYGSDDSERVVIASQPSCWNHR
jgi:hypothetical protein